MSDALLTIGVVVAVLVIPLIITNLFVRKMYYRCSTCSSLNAKRRTHCRICGSDLIDPVRPDEMTPSN